MSIGSLFANFLKEQPNTTPAPLPSATTDQDFSKLQIIDKITGSRFPLFRVYSPDHKEYLVLKMFPYKNQQMSPAYVNESRIQSLSHPNIITVYGTQDNQRTSCGSKKSSVSCILMELAPLGDFADLVRKNKIFLDQTLARTFFRQLVEGVKYLHNSGIAHMDLKLENFLLGKDLNLKIIDFDLSYKDGEPRIRSKGTANYRAPEVRNMVCLNTIAADIYSMGIVLFALKTGGLPYLEDTLVDGYNLEELMMNGSEEFWNIHKHIQGDKVDFDEDFKSLFLSMVKPNPSERITLNGIKKSKWFQEAIYSNEELAEPLHQLIGEMTVLSE
jgi:serine/threonine protein kinase